MGKTKKVINIVLFVVFLLFALMQLNDPDGWLWFGIYLLVSILCLYSNFRTISKPLLVLVIAALVISAIFHFSLFLKFLQTENKEEIFGEMVYLKPYLEGSREFLGLLLAALAVGYQLKRKRP